MDTPLHMCAGTEGGKPTINRLGVVHLDRLEFWYEGTLWATVRDGVNKGSTQHMSLMLVECVLSE